MSILDDLRDKLFPPKYPSARFPIAPTTVPSRPVPIAIPPNAPDSREPFPRRRLPRIN